MKKLASFSIVLTAMAVMSCGSREQKERVIADVPLQEEQTDATIYGMACEGCNDTLVIFLREPYRGTDPDTLNILNASRRHRVFGTPRIGAKLAITRSTTDSTAAQQVIVMGDLLGKWCYRVLPSLRERAGMNGQSLQQLPDSVREMLNVEREYGMLIKSDSVVYPVGIYRGTPADGEEEPVVYPEVKRYRQWYIDNGLLVLSEIMVDSLGNQQSINADTASFVALTRDTLVLRFNDGEHGYYRSE